MAGESGSEEKNTGGVTMCACDSLQSRGGYSIHAQTIFVESALFCTLREKNLKSHQFKKARKHECSCTFISAN